MLAAKTSQSASIKTIHKITTAKLGFVAVHSLSECKLSNECELYAARAPCYRSNDVFSRIMKKNGRDTPAITNNLQVSFSAKLQPSPQTCLSIEASAGDWPKMYAFFWVLLILVRTDLTSSECWCPRSESIPEEVDSYQLKSVMVGQCQCSSAFVRKCCNTGYHLVKSLCVKDAEKLDFNVTVYDSHTPVLNFDFRDIVVGHMNCKSYVLDPSFEENDVFYIQRNGSMLLGDERLDANNYCVENIDGKGFSGLVCFPNEVETRQLTRHFNSISTYIMI